MAQNNNNAFSLTLPRPTGLGAADLSETLVALVLWHIRLSKFNAYKAITQSPRLFRPIVFHPS